MARVAPAARTPGLGRVAWIGRLGAKDPWSAVRGEQPPRMGSLLLCAGADFCTPALTLHRRARRPLPTERVTASVGSLLWVCTQLPLQRLRPWDSRTGRSCAPRGPHPQSARCVGGAEPCSPVSPRRTRPPVTY